MRTVVWRSADGRAHAAHFLLFSASVSPLLSTGLIEIGMRKGGLSTGSRSDTSPIHDQTRQQAGAVLAGLEGPAPIRPASTGWRTELISRPPLASSRGHSTPGHRSDRALGGGRGPNWKGKGALGVHRMGIPRGGGRAGGTGPVAGPVRGVSYY